MFRLHFDHRSGRFVIQVLQWGTLWRTVYHKTPQGAEPLEFTTYADARSWIESIGLADLYDEQHPKTYRQFIANGGVLR